ncbi:hypothetical protein BM536_038950 [Streptomyces phaeoluteigriseus]|uniref:Uncharacterized protein n=1 Tax=Streptomyces phaeoluteigriseus TaxID=114686 RepID=A0A1V6MH61_9ACTN|nr:DUF6417 family protein [Streptomyces phaeoluteigriseus]OQD51653.1 hypothetical protein BM536_038950 [Streptomyces phaeoluteigriseus]
MDDYAHLELDEIDFAPVEYDEERLPLLTLGEAHALLRTVAREGGPVAAEADGLSKEIAARIPSAD